MRSSEELADYIEKIINFMEKKKKSVIKKLRQDTKREANYMK